MEGRASSPVKPNEAWQHSQPHPTLSTISFRTEVKLSNPEPKPRRWTVIASGLLCGVLAVVVLFTNRSAFFSPLAVVVVAAIGLAAVLLQLRLRNRTGVPSVRQPVWLNLIGTLLAVSALFSDLL